METKDLIYAIGILITAAIGLVSFLLNKKTYQLNKDSYALNTAALRLNFENRKNVLREHLYKEQMSFFKELSVQIVSISYDFDIIYYDQEITDVQSDLLEEKITALDKYFDANILLLPNEIFFDKISNVTQKANKLLTIAIETNGKIPEEKYPLLFDAYALLIEDIRDFAGIEELTVENKKLYERKLKMRHTEEVQRPHKS